MTVKQLAEKAGFEIVVSAEPDREVQGVYIGDLLSWVMGRAREDNAWITIMSNINVIAVATLSDVSCVVLSENVKLDEDALGAARAKGVNVLSSPLASYETAIKLAELS